MQVDYLIIGQGIAGTMLSWFLHKEGKSYIIIDEPRANSSSKVAAGVINPITGRRFVRSWMIDQIMPFAAGTYTEMGDYLQTQLIFRKSIIDFFPTPQGRDNFVNCIAEDDTYAHTYPDQNHFNQYFHYDFGCGEISPAYTVNLHLLLASWKKRLLDGQALLEERFDPNELKVHDDGVVYQHITASKAIFCEGISAESNPWFGLLPYSANKGEALVIECPGLTNEHLFKKSMALVPLPVQNTFWVGSTYQNKFADSNPTQEFYDGTVAYLQSWLKLPFKVLSHKAAIRPATVERRPFVGLHPQFSALGILNGMGSKGVSLTPFFANQLVQHLVHGLPITDAANVARFTRILTK